MGAWSFFFPHEHLAELKFYPSCIFFPEIYQLQFPHKLANAFPCGCMCKTTITKHFLFPHFDQKEGRNAEVHLNDSAMLTCLSVYTVHILFKFKVIMMKERHAKSWEVKLHYAVCSWETLNFKDSKSLQATQEELGLKNSWGKVLRTRHRSTGSVCMGTWHWGSTAEHMEGVMSSAESATGIRDNRLLQA